MRIEIQEILDFLKINLLLLVVTVIINYYWNGFIYEHLSIDLFKRVIFIIYIFFLCTKRPLIVFYLHIKCPLAVFFLQKGVISNGCSFILVIS